MSYNSENTKVLATYEQKDGNIRMLLLHEFESGRLEYVIGSYFNVFERVEGEGCKEYEWTWGHYFDSVVDAVDYWQREIAADLLDGFDLNGGAE